MVKSSQGTLTQLVATSQITFGNLVQASQEKLDGSVRHFGSALNEQRDAVEKFIRGTTEVRRAVDKLEKIYTECEDFYKGLDQTLPKIKEAFSTMAIDQKDASLALKSISDNNNQATKAVEEIAQQLVQTNPVQNTQQAAKTMQQTANTLQTIATHMGKTVEQQIQLQNHLDKKSSQKSSKPASQSFIRILGRGLFGSRKAKKSLEQNKQAI